MILYPPFEISSRLLPGLRVGNAWIQLEYAKRPGRGGRVRYRWTIDIEGVEGPDDGGFSGDDLESGNLRNQGLQEGFASLLSFLSACGESVSFTKRTGLEGENNDLFPPEVSQWAAENEDELSSLSCDLEESEDDLIEEA